MMNTGEGRAYIGSHLSVLRPHAADPLIMIFAKVAAEPRKIKMIFSIT